MLQDKIKCEWGIQKYIVIQSNLESSLHSESGKISKISGPNGDSNPGPRAPKARIIPLDHLAILTYQLILCLIITCYHLENRSIFGLSTLYNFCRMSFSVLNIFISQFLMARLQKKTYFFNLFSVDFQLKWFRVKLTKKDSHLLIKAPDL